MTAVADSALRASFPKLSHVQHDAMGHFSSRIRDEEWRARRRSRWSWYSQRHADLMAVIKARIAPASQIPETDDADEMLRVVAYHMQAAEGPERLLERMDDWCARMAPWARVGASCVLNDIVADVEGKRRDLTAVRLGVVLRVSWAERCELGLRTIRPFDLTPGEFARKARDRKLEMDRVRSAASRARRGQSSREDYRWQADRRPWAIVAVSRRTWDRYKAAGRLLDLIGLSNAQAPRWLVAVCTELDRKRAALVSEAAPEAGKSASQLGEASTVCDELSPTAALSPIPPMERAAGDGLGATPPPFRRFENLRIHGGGARLDVSGHGRFGKEGSAFFDTLNPRGVASDARQGGWRSAG